MKNFPPRLTHSSGAPLSLDRSRLLLAFREPPERPVLERALESAGLKLEPDALRKGLRDERVNHTDRRFWAQSSRPIEDEHFAKIQATLGEVGLEWIGPVYRLDDEQGRRGLLTFLPDVLLIRSPDDAHAGDELRLAEASGRRPLLVEVPEKSRFLAPFRYFVMTDLRELNAYGLRERLIKQLGRDRLDVRFETMPLLKPTAVVPNDTLFAQQWNMTIIDAGGAGTTGWDLSTGVPAIVVCVLDEGCDLTHPDLVARYAGQGINLGTMMPPGSPTGNHGTACAGIAVGSYNNGTGVAGVAGNCGLVPAAVVGWTDVEIAAGINWAATPTTSGGGGASVISMSFGWDPWDHAVIDPAIQNAYNNGLVMCVATHNYNGPITYPATNPLVMAVGASDQTDNRASFSDYGPEISVVAPGENIPTTDIQGAAGYVPGDYDPAFAGTSAATPHVAGLAALIRSLYSSMSNVQVRSLIERTAEKSGSVPYNAVAGYPSGTWNQEMGYGRINILRALDNADVFIRDMPADTGAEPSPAGNFWDYSDVVVRISDDNVFNPANPLQSRFVELGQLNYIYVRVTNNGPAAARNVTCTTRITPYVGLQFIYPQDWTNIDSMHVEPTPVTASFASIAPGATAIAKFVIDIAQTQTLSDWQTNHPWHPCLLARVIADNDYTFDTSTTGDASPKRNNLAQRNLSVIDVLAKAHVTFPFVAGHRLDAGRTMSIRIDRGRLPPTMPLLLSLDDDGRDFPRVGFDPAQPDGLPAEHGGGLIFLERTRIKTELACCSGVLTLEKGSRFDPAPRTRLGKVRVAGGDVVLRDGKRFVQVRDSSVTVHVEKAPNRFYPLSLQATIPAQAQKGEQFPIRVSQLDAGGTAVGGATVIYVAS